MSRHIFQILNIAPGAISIKQLSISIDVKLAFQKVAITVLYSRKEDGISEQVFEIIVSPCTKIIWEDLSLADDRHRMDGSSPFPEIFYLDFDEGDKGKRVVVGTAYFEVIAYGEITVSKTW